MNKVNYYTLSQLGKMFKSCTTIPIEFSEDRRTAALGAAWSKACL